MTSRSVIVDIECCGQCGTPFARIDRSHLHPIQLKTKLPRNPATFTLQCSCGHVSIVFDGGTGELALVPDDFITGADGA